MINRVVLVGRLTRDPELRYTSNNIPNATFSLAVNRPFSNQQGERQADFINVVVWNKQAENVKRYVTQGSLVGVEGRLQSRSYLAQDGSRRYVTEVVAESVQFLDSRSSDSRQANNVNTPFEMNNTNEQFYQNTNYSFNNTNNTNNTNNSNFTNDPFSDYSSSINIADDDLPF